MSYMKYLAKKPPTEKENKTLPAPTEYFANVSNTFLKYQIYSQMKVSDSQLLKF